MVNILVTIVIFIMVTRTIIYIKFNEPINKKEDIENAKIVKEETENEKMMKEIDQNGYIEDKAGNTFDEYIISKYCTLYYNSNDNTGKIYLLSMKEYLDNNCDSILDFFNIDNGEITEAQLFMYANFEDYRQTVFQYTGLDVYKIGGPIGFTIEDRMYMTYSKDGLRLGKNVEYLYKTALHEYVHCITNYIQSEPPIWLFEGVACFLAGQNIINEDDYSEFINTGLPPGYVLNTSGRYNYGYSLTSYIAEEYGNDGLLKLITLNGDYTEAFGLSKEQFEHNWIQFIKNKYY